MKMYFVESELYPCNGFASESDRNEMALALYEEHLYFLTMRTMNWYENGIMAGIEEDASENVRTWEISPNYSIPKQVAFWDETHYVGGIAYGDEIICGCCGGVFSIEDIVECAPRGVNPIVSYEDWVDVSHEMMSDNERIFDLEDEEYDECD